MYFRRPRIALLLATSSAAALIVGGCASARAACVAVSSGPGFTNPAGPAVSCISVNGATVTGSVTNAGTITPGSPTGISITGNSTITGAVVSSGAVSIAGSNGIAVKGALVLGGITNSGTISGLGSGTAGILVRDVATFAGGVSNNGTIRVGGSGIVVANVIAFSGGIANSGTISAGAGFGAGIAVSGSSFSGGIFNNRTISAMGDFGAGIAIGASSFSGGIVNSGTISAAGVHGVGIAIDGTSFSGGVFNSGTISATGGTGVGIAVGGPSGIDVFDSGTITAGGAAIQFAGSGNTLTLGPGFAITGNVIGTGSDTFRLGGSGSGSFDASLIGSQYQSFASFAKVGDSTWTLTGTNALVLPWSVQQGLLNVAAGASLPNSPFTVQAGTLSVDGTVGAVTVDGGILLGSGTLGALAVNSGGTVAPGHSIGTLNIVGNVSFTAGSTYQAQTDLTGRSDLIRASGTAMLAGGTVQAVSQPGVYGAPVTYAILTAAGGRTGTFATVTDNLPYLSATLSYDANDVFLTVARNARFFQNQAVTPNERAVGSAFDRFATNDPLFLGLAGLTGAATWRALDALSGEIHASVQSTLIDDSRFMRMAMLGRLRQAAYASAPGTLAALGLDGPTLVYQNATPFPVDEAPPAPVPADGPDIAFWSQAVGALGSFEGNTNAASVSRDLAGFFSGFDARFGDASRAGIAGGYSHSSVGISNRASSAGIDTAHLGGYAGTSLAGLNVRSGAAVAFHTIDTDRTVTFPGFLDQAAAHYDGRTGQVFGEVGYGLACEPVAVEPFAGAAWVGVATGRFVETGGPSALAGSGNADGVVTSSLGVRAATSYAVQDDLVLIPRATVAWQHAFGDVSPTAALAFPSNGLVFDVAGVPIARDAALVDAGFDLRVSASAKLGLSYSGELARNARDNAVKGNFTWTF
jgi:outer membrane autotransporter protein